MTSAPSTVIASEGSGAVAGPVTTLPSEANSLPWHAQMNAVPDANAPIGDAAQLPGLVSTPCAQLVLQTVTMQHECVHTADNAYNPVGPNQ